VPLQAKLLQVLQDGEFRGLGGKHDVHVDVRVVAATNKDLELAVAEGQFREDLFFRLNVVSINMPPLRDRREEIPLLCDYFLKKYSVQYNKPYTALSQDTMRLFMEFDWPGNIRELENLIKRTVVLGTEAPIQKEISHGIAMAAHRLQQPAVIPHPSAAPHQARAPHAAAGNGNGNGAAAAAGPMTPAAIAAAAAEAGNYSLKD